MSLIPLTPRTSDGKMIVLPCLFPGGVFQVDAGVGDADGVIGAGTVFTASSDAVGDTVVEWQFCDWVYLAGGTCRYVGGQIGDYMDFEVYAPASSVEENSQTQGNCNLVEVATGLHMIVPAAGDGTHDVDLDTAVPVPAYSDEEDSSPNGFWEWTSPDTGCGEVSAGTPQNGHYNLFDFKVPLAKHANHVNLLGDWHEDMRIPATKPKKILPQWKFKVVMHNCGHTGLKSVWRLTIARVRTT